MVGEVDLPWRTCQTCPLDMMVKGRASRETDEKTQKARTCDQLQWSRSAIVIATDKISKMLALGGLRLVCVNETICWHASFA